MGGACYVGISASEIQIVANALNIQVDEDLLDDVRVIASGAAEVLNEKKQ